MHNINKLCAEYITAHELTSCLFNKKPNKPTQIWDSFWLIQKMLYNIMPILLIYSMF